MARVLDAMLRGTPLVSFKIFMSCIACEGTELTRSYCEEQHTRGIAKEVGGVYWLDATAMKGGASPHLHVICDACGFAWLEKPAWTQTENESLSEQDTGA